MLLNSKNILEFYCQNSTWVFINPKSDADNKLWIKRYPVPHSTFLLRAFNWLWEVQWRVKSRSSFQLSVAARSCHRFWVVKECCCWCSLFPEKLVKLLVFLLAILKLCRFQLVCVCVLPLQKSASPPLFRSLWPLTWTNAFQGFIFTTRFLVVPRPSLPWCKSEQLCSLSQRIYALLLVGNCCCYCWV